MGFHNVALVLLLLCMVMAEGGLSNVVDYGAIGNGQTDDSEAFLKAWKAICGSTSMESFMVPEGKTFLLSPVVFQGPCKCPSINFQILGKIIAPSMKDFGNGKGKWLEFCNVDGLIVNGGGDIDGKGSSWWTSCEDGDNCGSKPPVLTFDQCKNLQVSGISITNAPRSHISMCNCADATISNIHITTPGTTLNTDGIDISESTRIQIKDSVIKTGDDCIALSTGCSYVNITGVNCGPGHGISIGSLGEDGSKGTVEEVHVQHCTFSGTQNAARIKTWQGGSGFARKITFKDITLVDSENPILIDQYYCDQDGLKNSSSAVEISDISFMGFTGTSATKSAVQLLCSQSVGCNRLVLDGINIKASSNLNDDGCSSKCINAHGTSSGSNIPNVPCLLPNDDDDDRCQ